MSTLQGETSFLVFTVANPKLFILNEIFLSDLQFFGGSFHSKGSACALSRFTDY